MAVLRVIAPYKLLIIRDFKRLHLTCAYSAAVPRCVLLNLHALALLHSRGKLVHITQRFPLVSAADKVQHHPVTVRVQIKAEAVAPYHNVQTGVTELIYVAVHSACRHPKQLRYLRGLVEPHTLNHIQHTEQPLYMRLLMNFCGFHRRYLKYFAR